MFTHPDEVFPLQTRFAFPTRVYLTNVPGFPRTASLLSHFSKSSLSSFLFSPSSWPCYFRIRTVYKAWQASFYHLKQIAVWVTFLMFRTLFSGHDLLIMWVVLSIAESVPFLLRWLKMSDSNRSSASQAQRADALHHILSNPNGNWTRAFGATVRRTNLYTMELYNNKSRLSPWTSGSFSSVNWIYPVIP